MKTLKTILIILLPFVLLLTACQVADSDGETKVGSSVNKPEDLPEEDYAFQVQGVESSKGSIYVAGLSGNYTDRAGFVASGGEVFTFKLCDGEGFVGYLWEPGASGLTSRTQYYGSDSFYTSYYRQAVRMDSFYPFTCSYQFNENGELTELYECVDLSGSNTYEDEHEVTFFFNFFTGSSDPDILEETEYFTTDEYTDEMIVQRMSELTGLDFFVTISDTDDCYTVDWSSDSTLIAGLDDREQKEDFTFYDVDSLRWFMMDSLWLTLSNKLGNDEIYFTMDGGEELYLAELYPVDLFPADIPYMGSAFYFAHANVTGDGDNDNNDGVTEDEALDLLSAFIDMAEDTAIISYGQKVIDGEMCWTFSYGKDTPEKFTAEEHYAVTDNGVILRMDMMDGQYKRI